ncbi:hypothetical protein ACVWYF_001244 [Hymenobacter sp. UYAg731]
MIVSDDLFLSGLVPGRIYYFVNPYISSDEPHYHICLKEIDGGVLLMSCCTSQFEKRSRYIKLSGLPTETLIWIKPDTDNNLKKDTYVDCNEYFKFTKSYLLDKYNDGHIKPTGELKLDHYEQIILGMIDSPRIEEEIKDSIRLSDM